MGNYSTSTIRENFENYLQNHICDLCPANILGMREMVSYHFGWDGSVTVPAKRLRPLLLSLTYASLGGKVEEVFQAASALEIFHNFTLIHDDIQDQGEIRHGHPALWTKVGIPLAINVGDYLSGLSQSMIGKLSENFSVEQRLKALNEFQDASLGVIQGQQLDIQYEKMDRVTVDEYINMISLKTAKLFSVSFALAAILAGYEDEFVRKLAHIGENLGLGFQIQDDYLGIWGNQIETGKSISTDLLTRKKTFPALTGLTNSKEFQLLWEKKVNDHEQLLAMKSFLERVEVNKDTLNLARAYYIEAQTQLNELLPAESAFSGELLSLVDSMFAPILTEA